MQALNLNTAAQSGVGFCKVRTEPGNILEGGRPRPPSRTLKRRAAHLSFILSILFIYVKQDRRKPEG